MVKKDARWNFARGCVRCFRVAGRLAGSIATMILGAAALGGAIAGMGIVILGETGSSRAQTHVLAAVRESVAGATPDGLMEARSAWVERKGRGRHARPRCLGASNGATELDARD